MAERHSVPTSSETPDWEAGRGLIRLQTTLRRSGVPDTYWQAEWDQCRVAGDLLDFVDDLPHQLAAGKGLVIMGPVGTGKSSTAALLCAEAIKAGETVRWEYVPNLLDELASWKTKAEAVDRCRRHDLLVWDDFGVDLLTPASAALLDRIVEVRYSRRRSMIITTNLSQQTLTGYDDPLMRRMMDRWKERCLPLTIGGQSMRQKATL